jgi:tripartite ATP-independent transporter DctM subunit
MDLITLIAVLLLVMFAILAGGMWIALSLAVVGFVAMTLQVSAPAGSVLAISAWQSATSWDLTALPMFIWMGEILYRTRLSEDLFRGLAPWLGRFPGRLLHVNVAACTVFAAVSGSSAATCATIGKITIPELRKRNYDEAMVVGSLAGAGTLGLLIPPSIILIVYGVAADVSIARLFVAGVLPGVLLVTLFSGYIALWALLHPGRTPPRSIRMSFGQKLWESRLLIPTVLLIAGVIGSIYAGIASPTESAALGVVGALILSGASGSLDWKTFGASVMGAMRTSCMIAFILTGAAFLTVAMGFTGVPRAMAEWIARMGLTPAELIGVLTLLFLVMGCFLDGISMVVLTAAVILPSVRAAGIDLLWFGIFIVLVVEAAQLTPPVGFNLYVLQALTRRNMFYVARVSLPFFCLMVAAVAIIWVFPEIVSYLPSKMFN